MRLARSLQHNKGSARETAWPEHQHSQPEATANTNTQTDTVHSQEDVRSRVPPDRLRSSQFETYTCGTYRRNSIRLIMAHADHRFSVG